MDIKRIAIIGAGELGSRHLQSFAKTDFPIHIQVIDPSQKSLSLAKRRFEELPKNINVKEIEFFENIDALFSDIDLTIIATNSNVRFDIFKNILEQRKTKNIVLEKVLFTSLAELDAAEEILRRFSVKAYVNCPKRGYMSSKIIFEKLKQSSSFVYTIEGENWGLGCNAIHFIDTMSFYCGSHSYSLDTSGLDSEFIKSKRPGFIEFTGAMTANFSSGRILRLISRKGEGISFQTTIESDHYSICLSEKQGHLRIFDKSNGLEENFDCKTPLQSDLTYQMARKIIFNGLPDLPDLLTSIAHHRPLVAGLLAFHNKIERKNETQILIT
jgi:hypothetical protein